MKKSLLLLLIFTINTYADSDSVNLEALKEWIATKRALTIDERSGELSISGDIRVKYIAVSEQENGFNNLGEGSYHPLIPENQYDVEFKFLLDYTTETTWASSKIDFDNNMGVYNGTFNRVLLERAFLGFRIFEKEDSTLDIEFGRRFLGYSFDSQIQFGALMDGILVLYNKTTPFYGDFYVYGAPFVVNEITSHISFVAEVGLLNILNTGFYAKYSLIDWDTKHYNDERLERLHEFVNSQFILGYRFQNPILNAVTVLYGAFLINTAAQKFSLLDNRKDNLAGYFGVSMGEIRKKNDWSLDLNFQFVQPQAIPARDFSGVGIYNPDGIGLYTLAIDGSGGVTVVENLVASNNYWGFRLVFLYALADTITLAQNISFSRPLMDLPRKFDFQKYKLEIIYAW
jgi:hypothetical protein